MPLFTVPVMAVRLRASTKTSAEEVLAMQLDAAGWHAMRQYAYAPPRRFRADFCVWSAEGVLPRDTVLVEIQGGIYSRKAHGSIEGILNDIARLNAATIAGFKMLRFTPQQVESGEAIETIEAALRRQ